MSLRQRVLRGAAWSVFGGNASQLVSFVFFLLISRLVGPAAFGAVAIALALVEISKALVVESLASVLVARRDASAADFDAAFPISIGLSICAGIVLAAAAPLLAAFYRMPALAEVLIALAWLTPIQAAARVQDAWLTRQMRFKALAARNVGAALAGGGAGLIAALYGLTHEALIVQQVVAAFAACALVWMGSAWRPSLNIDRERMSSIFRASAALAPASLISVASAMLDSLAAGMTGATAAGIYGLAKRIRLALQFGFSSGLVRSATPAFASTPPRDLPRVFDETLRVSMMAAFPVFVGIAALAPELIAIFLDHRWAPAAGAMALLLFSGPFAIASAYAEATLLIAERRRTIVLLKSATVLLLIAALAVAAPRGPTAIAGAALLVALASCVTAYIAAAPVAGLNLRRCLSAIAGPLLLAAAMYLLLHLMRTWAGMASLSAFVRGLAFVSVGAMVYVAGAYFLARPALLSLIRAAQVLLQRRPS